jgi:hypothetical protein
MLAQGGDALATMQSLAVVLPCEGLASTTCTPVVRHARKIELGFFSMHANGDCNLSKQLNICQTDGPAKRNIANLVESCAELVPLDAQSYG